MKRSEALCARVTRRASTPCQPTRLGCRLATHQRLVAQTCSDQGHQSMPWMVARTKAYEEHRADFHLRARECETYLPRFLNNKTRKVEPLFPQYLFVQQQIDEMWRKIRYSFGVMYLLMSGEIPKTV